MSKLVYKSINEIINGRFMTELNAGDGKSPEEKSDEIRQEVAQKKVATAQKEKNDADVVDKQIELKKTIARKKRDDLQNSAPRQDENFDAQSVPGMPPVGMPPTAAPMPKPATGPNYEGGNMTKTQLCQAHEATSNIMASIEDYDNLPDWVKAKITLASEYLVKCESFLNAKDQEHEDSQKDNHMSQSPQAARPPMPPASSPSASAGGSPLLGISLGKVQSVSPGE